MPAVRAFRINRHFEKLSGSGDVLFRHPVFSNGNRMPIILHPDAYDLLLDKDVNNTEQLLSLYPPYPADLLTLYPVSTLVNSPRNDTPACIEPVPS